MFELWDIWEEIQTNFEIYENSDELLLNLAIIASNNFKSFIIG